MLFGRWRFIIHGGIDGYSRIIVFLKANTNNEAATVFQLFLGAVEKYGLPSRVRTVKDGANVDIARYMLSHSLRGPDRGSHITGWSVHNQRIDDKQSFFSTVKLDYWYKAMQKDYQIHLK